MKRNNEIIDESVLPLVNINSDLKLSRREHCKDFITNLVPATGVNKYDAKIKDQPRIIRAFKALQRNQFIYKKMEFANVSQLNPTQQWPRPFLLWYSTQQ